MADEEPEEDGPLRASLVGLQLQFQKQILSVLIDKGFLTGEEARLMMFDLAERLRHGSDLAGTEEIAYYFAELVERLGNELAGRETQ